MSAVLSPEQRLIASGIAAAFPLTNIAAHERGARQVQITVCEVPMLCAYEFIEAVKAIGGSNDHARPGAPAYVTLIACRIGGVKVYDCLDGWLLGDAQIERIEQAILEEFES